MKGTVHAVTRDRPVRDFQNFVGPGPVRDLEFFLGPVRSDSKIQIFVGLVWSKINNIAGDLVRSGFGPWIPARDSVRFEKMFA